MHDIHNIAGIDGCAAGWVIATLDTAFVLPTLRLDRFKRVGVDMPIGLIDGPSRACDIAARRYLGRAGSSVFPAPPRAALHCTNYRDALAAARSATGRGISKQTFNIMAKVAELDRFIDETNRSSVLEVHPECSFKMLNAGDSLPTKKTIAGQDLRRRLLVDHFDLPAAAPSGAAMHDVLDAYAVLWSVRRFELGQHTSFGDGRLDVRGIEMRIIC